LSKVERLTASWSLYALKVAIPPGIGNLLALLSSFCLFFDSFTLSVFIFRISGRPHFGLAHFCSNLTERAALGYSGDASLVAI